MGGMGFIETPRVDCLINSSRINDNMVTAASKSGVTRYFFSSSACAYNTTLQQDHDVTALKESDAYPADADRGYGWEKLIGEQKCEEVFLEKEMEIRPEVLCILTNVQRKFFGLCIAVTQLPLLSILAQAK